MSVAKLSQGTLFKMGDGAAPEVFTTIPEVMRLTGPNVQLDLEEVTSHDSPNLFKEWIAGLSDGDTVDAEINWRASNTIHKNIRVAQYAGTLKNFKIVFPDTSDNTVAFSAFIMSFPPTADAGKPMRNRLRLKITGAPVWT